MLFDRKINYVSTQYKIVGKKSINNENKMSSGLFIFYFFNYNYSCHNGVLLSKKALIPS